MPKLIYVFAALFALQMPGLALAQVGGEGKVMALQSPAWLVSNGVKKALRPGQLLQQGDRILTEAGGKVQLALGNRAEFQLGAMADLKLNELSPAAQPQDSSYNAFLEVVFGAFRYVGSRFGKSSRPENVRVRVGLSTVGLSRTEVGGGTDFWGVTDGKRDTVVLIEGAISIKPDNFPGFDMSEPLTIVQNNSISGPSQIEAVNANVLSQSAALTTLDYGAGVMSEEGSYQVVLGAFQDFDNASIWAEKINQMGYPAEQETGTDARFFRVAVNHFATVDDARTFIQIAKERLGIDGAWLRKI